MKKELLLWEKKNPIWKRQKNTWKKLSSIERIKRERIYSDKIKEAVWNYAEKKSRTNVLWPIRAALTGLEKSPDPFAVAGVLGKKKQSKD